MGSSLVKRASQLATACLLLLVACGGGGGNGNGAIGDSATMIDGRVANVASASLLAGGGAGVSTVAGIQVEAQQSGIVLDTTTTDIEGRFTLEFVSDGRVDLVFIAEGVTLTLGLDVVPGTVVTLVVELRIDEDDVVIIDDDVIGSRPIRCETGTFSVIDEDLDLTIDGEGEDCIRATGNCIFDIEVRSLTLVGCERCINAAGGSDVSIVTDPGEFACRSFEDGIRAGGNASVFVGAAAGVDIVSSDDAGIRADGTADVALRSLGTCRVEGDEDALDVSGAASIDLDACFAVELIDHDDGDDDDGFDGGDAQHR